MSPATEPFRSSPGATALTRCGRSLSAVTSLTRLFLPRARAASYLMFGCRQCLKLLIPFHSFARLFRSITSGAAHKFYDDGRRKHTHAIELSEACRETGGQANRAHLQGPAGTVHRWRTVLPPKSSQQALQPEGGELEICQGV